MSSVLSRHVRAWTICVAVAAAALLSSGCATVYINDVHNNVDVTKLKHPALPQPTQLMFSFQTRGTANARATELLAKEVTDTVNLSGLFSSASPTAVPNGSVLSVTINNVGDVGDAATKGFVTGLTLGLAGNTVTDGYVCTIDYLPAAGSTKVTRTVNHAVHTNVGAKGAPPNATKAKNFEEAARLMTRQVVGAALTEVSNDPALQ